MFIITAKLSGKKLAVGAVVLAAVLLAVHAGVGLAGEIAAFGAENTANTEDTAGSAQQDTETASALALTNAQRIKYLAACGWEVDESSCTVREVIIPSDFDETYQNYVDLQARQGFELEKYRGKRVKQITYVITNAPDDEELMAELLVYRGSIIAGDIYSMQTDGGFTRGLMDTDTDDTDNSEESNSTNTADD